MMSSFDDGVARPRARQRGESDDVRLSIGLARALAGRLNDEAERREISSSDLVVELMRRGLAEPREVDRTPEYADLQAGPNFRTQTVWS
jgi:hypothetical protein